jgi:hypothetical protein
MHNETKRNTEIFFNEKRKYRSVRLSLHERTKTQQTFFRKSERKKKVGNIKCKRKKKLGGRECTRKKE